MIPVRGNTADTQAADWDRTILGRRITKIVETTYARNDEIYRRRRGL